ncbi:MAG: twin-arginine translocation signal domain-containing protein, partial [Propionibacteriaceae bacterium]|nr:twin-arginine translocation signal domain-containing protein [Propionibacteriaceae bacterium]
MLSRRRFLTHLAGAGALGVVGCTPGSLPEPPTRDRSRCVPRGDLPLRERIGEARLHYEPTGQARPVRIDPGFHHQLEAWWADWLELSGLATDRIDDYGAWIDGRGNCDSWHHSGRAYDIAAIRQGADVAVSCREDLW